MECHMVSMYKAARVAIPHGLSLYRTASPLLLPLISASTTDHVTFSPSHFSQHTFSLSVIFFTRSFLRLGRFSKSLFPVAGT